MVATAWHFSWLRTNSGILYLEEIPKDRPVLCSSEFSLKLRRDQQMWEWEACSVDARRSKPGGGQSPLAARGTPDLTPVSCVSAYNPLTPNVWVYTSQQVLLQLSEHQRGVLKSTCGTKYQRCCRLRAWSPETVPYFRSRFEANPPMLLASWLELRVPMMLE